MAAKLVVVFAALIAACSAFAPATPALQLSKIAAASRAEDVSMMARRAPKKAAAAPKKKAAPKKSAPKKSTSSGKSPVGKGGIFPWITNEPGTYGKPLMLSAVDFTSDDGDAWIGWGFMPKSVKASLYPKGYKGLLNK